ncbi:uncharacterized protein K452DRAFT_167348 [Aplosporella prunicola CBS 121167]|uniref:Uncharacterized protein n=1 Tax=Aplosporella prunicola CBS 121167 TaxID=1176127 RepID=A0A6A6BGA2_9PEZI|nr:uncharacterized protein K452DRAFT_167348 [Aplosporella prunicola CBS 121167]KAF2143192.1 hypothetical protein K452DRAFT_167348 [Aplosporella prunicola CBS 121167]
MYYLPYILRTVLVGRQVHGTRPRKQPALLLVLRTRTTSSQTKTPRRVARFFARPTRRSRCAMGWIGWNRRMDGRTVGATHASFTHYCIAFFVGFFLSSFRMSATWECFFVLFVLLCLWFLMMILALASEVRASQHQCFALVRRRAFVWRIRAVHRRLCAIRLFFRRWLRACGLMSAESWGRDWGRLPAMPDLLTSLSETSRVCCIAIVGVQFSPPVASAVYLRRWQGQG